MRLVHIERQLFEWEQSNQLTVSFARWNNLATEPVFRKYPLADIVQRAVCAQTPNH